MLKNISYGPMCRKPFYFPAKSTHAKRRFMTNLPTNCRTAVNVKACHCDITSNGFQNLKIARGLSGKGSVSRGLLENFYCNNATHETVVRNYHHLCKPHGSGLFFASNVVKRSQNSQVEEGFSFDNMSGAERKSFFDPDAVNKIVRQHLGIGNIKRSQPNVGNNKISDNTKNSANLHVLTLDTGAANRMIKQHLGLNARATEGNSECVQSNSSLPHTSASIVKRVVSRESDMDFISPKAVMYEYFQKVSSYLSYKRWELLLEKPTFYYKDCCMCTYQVNWPKAMAFDAGGYSQRNASENAARCVLSWLSDAGIINKQGKPVFSKINSIRSFSTSAGRTDSSLMDSNADSCEEKPPDQTEIHLKAIKKQHPAPKNVLHNYFDVVSKELKQKDLRLELKYKLVKHSPRSSSWMCTYHVKWPEKAEFSHSGPTKQIASYEAALRALAWLKEKDRILSTGLPKIYDQKEIREVTKSKVAPFVLTEAMRERLGEVVLIYESSFLPSIEVNNNVTLDVQSEEKKPSDLEEIGIPRLRKQRYLGLHKYLAREPVKLPISAHRDEFVQKLENNRVVIIKGEPGCGKSTRVPQYILEAWAKEDGLDGENCKIAVTQPRRIAALSLAERVANERGDSVGDVVGYQVRFETKFNHHTGRILYCTTGILLRHIQTDPKLSSFTHIILDEAHERDVNTDLLMNLLRHALNLNPHLKLIVMSATIDTDMFQTYFEGSDVMHIPGMTYPVSANFVGNSKGFDKTRQMCDSAYPTVVHDEVVSLIHFIHKNRREGAILCFLPGWEDIKKIRDALTRSAAGNGMSVLCLHSKLKDGEQFKIFSRPPPSIRKVILATNIAETSVTIDDVVYVIDTGIHKEKRFDFDKGIVCIDNQWISKASMQQRKGRAGRCQEGESFHLYKQSKYENFEPYTMPEILRTSLTKIVLDSKVYSNNMNAVEFLSQLPTPPDNRAIARAVKELQELELLDDFENLTSLGRTLSDFQLEPKLSKALVNSVIFKCVTPMVDIITLFSGEIELFTSSLLNKERVRKIKQSHSNSSDHLALMRLFEKWLDYAERSDYGKMQQFCNQNDIMPHKLETVDKLRNIHFDYLEKGLSNVLPIADDFSDNDEMVLAVLLSGVGTVLQYRPWDIVKGRMKKVNVLLTRHNQRATITSESVNFAKGKYATDYLLYINETQSNIRRSTIIREASIISPLTLLLFKNNKLSMEDVPAERHSDKINSQDQVLVKLLGTRIEFIMDKRDAMVLFECKNALQSGVQYYVTKLTQKGKPNVEVNKRWNAMLLMLNKLFLPQRT